MGILDFELDYAENLMNYLNNRKEFPLEVMIFSGLDSLRALLTAQKLELLLIAQDMLSDESLPENTGAVVLLSEKGSYVSDNYPAIYKFQSAETVMRELLMYYQEDVRGASIEEEGKHAENTKLIAVFSPQGGSGKTTFSLALGIAYAENEKVLYVGMEPFGSSFLSEGEQNGFADLLYYVKQKNHALLRLVQTLCIKVGHVECILSNGDFSDLFSMEPEDIDFLVDGLAQRAGYRFIIFDLGYLDAATFHLMERCDKIFIPSLHKDKFMDKKEALARSFAFSEKQKLYQRLLYIDLPYDQRLAAEGFSEETALSGAVGNFIRELLETEKE